MYRWSKHIDYYKSIKWVVKHRYYKVEEGGTDFPDREVTYNLLLAFIVWDAAEQKWEAQIGVGPDSQRFFTDEGTYRKPPRKLVELLVAARGE